MNKIKEFSIDTVFECDTTYIGTQAVYDIFPSDEMQQVEAWYTSMNSGNIPLRAAFVLRGLKNVTIDLKGAKLVFHGRMMPFAAFDCENITFKNFSIDYDRPFYTQGTVLEAEGDSIVIEIPKLFSYRIEGQDFIACGETWEHRLIRGDMLFRCFDNETGRPSKHSGVILGLIGEKIFPRDNPPLPIHHIKSEDLGEGKVRLFNFPETFRPQVGEILAMTHEDRSKVGILLERCTDTNLEHIRLLHIGAMGLIASLCHNITANDFSMYLDEETGDRIVSINADSFHTFHCSGLIKVENCRFENMLDDAINIHGNYLVCKELKAPKTLWVQNRASGIQRMQYLMPGDEFVIYKGNTQEVRCKGIARSAEYLPDQSLDLMLTLEQPLDAVIEEGDCLEILRTPEIEVRNCYSKCMGGFRISSDKRVLIENCTFETSGFAVALTGDMNYWFENTGVKDLQIRNCRFLDCGQALTTGCGFVPTEAAPYYHQNISFIENEIIGSRKGKPPISLKDVYGFTYRDNKVSNLPKETQPVVLERCENIK